MSDCNPVSTPCDTNMHLSDADCPPLDKRNPEVVRDYQMGANVSYVLYTRRLQLRREPVRSFHVQSRFVPYCGGVPDSSVFGCSHALLASRTARIRETLALLPLTGILSQSAVIASQLAQMRITPVARTGAAAVSSWTIMFNGAMVTWNSKRQQVKSIRSTESEFYPVSQYSLDCVHLRWMLEFM